MRFKSSHSFLIRVEVFDFCRWLHENFPYVNIVVEKDVVEELENELPFVKVVPPDSRKVYNFYSNCFFSYFMF